MELSGSKENFSKENFSYISGIGTLHFLSPGSNRKKTTPRKFLLFSKRKVCLIFWKMETLILYASGNRNPGKLLIFQEVICKTSESKFSYAFSKLKYFLIIIRKCFFSFIIFILFHCSHFIFLIF